MCKTVRVKGTRLGGFRVELSSGRHAAWTPGDYREALMELLTPTALFNARFQCTGSSLVSSRSNFNSSMYHLPSSIPNCTSLPCVVLLFCFREMNRTSRPVSYRDRRHPQRLLHSFVTPGVQTLRRWLSSLVLYNLQNTK